MPYGFNTDRSRYDLGDIGKMVVLENDLAFVVTYDFAEKRYDSTALAALGISDINDWVVIGAMVKKEDGKTWRTSDTYSSVTKDAGAMILAYYQNDGINIQIINPLGDPVE